MVCMDCLKKQQRINELEEKLVGVVNGRFKIDMEGRIQN